MSYINMFPTPLFYTVEKELSQEILPVAVDYLNSLGSNYLNQENYVSTYNVNTAGLKQQTDNRLDKLSSFLKTTARKYFEDHCIDSSKWKLEPYYLFNRIKSGGAHPIHSHPESVLSGCFYLKVPENSSPIVFNDPRDYWKFIEYPPIFGSGRERYSLLPEYVINPTEGMLLMWPSWLEHQVPTSTVSDERIVVAFNLNV